MSSDNEQPHLTFILVFMHGSKYGNGGNADLSLAPDVPSYIF